MPRKSQALRLQQTKDLVVAYEAAGAGGTSLRFMNDMVSSMTRGKYPTKRQRDWLDRLIEEGVPEPKGDATLLAEMASAQEALQDHGFDWEARTLADFIHRERQGWGFSDKQVALRDRILKKAVDVQTGEVWLTVTPEMRETLEVATRLWNSYAVQWQLERPAVHRAVSKVRQFLLGNDNIEQYHYDKVTYAMRSKLRQVENPRFKQGDLGYRRNRDGVKECWICVSDVHVTENGNIVNDWIAPTGEKQTLRHESLSKR